MKTRLLHPLVSALVCLGGPLGAQDTLSPTTTGPLLECYFSLRRWSIPQTLDVSSRKDQPMLVVLERERNERALSKGLYLYTKNSVRAFTLPSQPTAPPDPISGYHSYYVRLPLEAPTQEIAFIISERKNGDLDLPPETLETLGGPLMTLEKTLTDSTRVFFDSAIPKGLPGEQALAALRDLLIDSIRKRDTLGNREKERVLASDTIPVIRIKAQFASERRVTVESTVKDLKGCTRGEDPLVDQAQQTIAKLKRSLSQDPPDLQNPLARRERRRRG